jgi:hypothetical protein
MSINFYFCIVKFFLFKILLLFSAFCYLASVTEFDSHECKQNYARENHSYVNYVPGKENVKVKIQHIKQIAVFPEYYTSFYNSVISIPQKKGLLDKSCTQKIFLLHEALLI